MKRLVLFVLVGGIAYTGYHYSVYGTLPWQPLPYLEKEDSAQGRINRLSSLYDAQIVYVFGPLDGREISNLRMELVRLREDLRILVRSEGGGSHLRVFREGEHIVLE